MDTEKKYLSVPEAAKMLGLNRSRVGALCREGRFQGAFKVGDTWAIPIDSVYGLVRYGSRGKGKLAAEKAEILQQVAEAGGVMVELPEDVQQAMGRADAVEKMRKKSHRKETREESA